LACLPLSAVDWPPGFQKRECQHKGSNASLADGELLAAAIAANSILSALLDDCSADDQPVRKLHARPPQNTTPGLLKCRRQTKADRP